jgi:hypothetical protein
MAYFSVCCARRCNFFCKSWLVLGESTGGFEGLL